MSLHYLIFSIYVNVVLLNLIIGQVNAQLSCFDSFISCGFWASEGECDRNSEWMLFNCEKSCGVCDSELDLPAMANTIVEDNFRPLTADCARIIQAKEQSNIYDNLAQTRSVPTGTDYRNRAFQRGCATPNMPNPCFQNICYHHRYRTFDGSCNNLMQSLRGAAYTPNPRLLEANYEDKVDRMVGTTIRTWPNPREITRQILSTQLNIPTKFNSLLMQFGQFISHDITRNTIRNTSSVCPCGLSSSNPLCANMPFSAIDLRKGKCIPMARSVPLCGTGFDEPKPRTQMNENSAFIDGSQIYGSDPTTAQSLRAGAFIRTRVIKNDIFPPAEGPENLLTGDARSNMFIGLAAIHTIFVRYHNKIASRFFQLNPHWDPERVYQETRKIIGAVIQVIAYEEFIPALLGTGVQRILLPYSGYKTEVDPGVSSEFSSAAYRLHGLIRESYRLVNRELRTVGDLRFVDGAGKIQRLLNAGTDLILRGMMTVPTKKPQRLTTQVTEELFFTSDMSSINIQRGRDHGLMPYVEYRKLCRLSSNISANDWPEVDNPELRRRVFGLYGGDARKIDLYVGGLLEEPIQNSLLGPTFSCIIADQFRRARDGDRFFYMNPQMYTAAQIATLRKISFAHVICETSDDFGRIPRSAFSMDFESSVLCNQLDRVDLSPWVEMSRRKT